MMKTPTHICMTLFKNLTAILLIFSGLSAHVEAAESKWVLFGKDKMFDHYYDEANFMRTPEDIIGVWLKVVPTQKKAKDALLEERRKRAFIMDGYEGYQFTVTAMEIDCPRKMRALIESRDYGEQGRVLDKVSAVTRNWIPIDLSEHPNGFYHQVLCKKHPN